MAVGTSQILQFSTQFYNTYSKMQHGNKYDIKVISIRWKKTLNYVDFSLIFPSLQVHRINMDCRFIVDLNRALIIFSAAH